MWVSGFMADTDAQAKPVNIRVEQQLHDIWVATHTPQWMLEAEQHDQDAQRDVQDASAFEVPF